MSVYLFYEIEIKDIEVPSVELYNSNNELIGVVKNEHSANDVRIQIAKRSLQGYYFKWNEKRIDISEDGEISNFPVGLWDNTQRQLAELFKIRRMKKGLI